MHGMLNKPLAIVTVTPEMATELLEHNTLNRPLNQMHVNRIARQIIDGKWRFNGDTVKVAKSGDVLDGQHRLWAIIEAKKPVETVIVRGIEREAFATIDTIRKPRSGGDTLALCGATRYRNIVAEALKWLLRWQNGKLEDYRAPQNRIENSDVEAAYANNPQMVRACERAVKLRGLGNPSVIGFIYYILSNRNEALAERMMVTLEDPSGVGITDPFFRLRSYFTSDHHKRKEPLVTIALAIKAANAASAGQRMQTLSWKNQGQRVEEFPQLKIAK